MSVNGRILRECAVDLIRASDLSPQLALARVERVRADLAEIQAALRADLAPRGPRLLRDKETAELIRSAA